MIQLNNLNKYFNKNKKNEIHVLNNVTLSLPEKGLVVILGESGSGKTTLLNVIGGLDKIGNGEIHFNDHEISKFNVDKWDELRNETIGYIFQNYYLQPQLSVYDNIAFVLKMIGISDKEEIDIRVSYVLKALGMYDFRKKKALQLSGGQQQRVAIARALVKNPNIIIADEPTGNLDSKNTADIMNIIKEIAKEKLVVLVTHEKELADFYANRIIEISDGKIISDRQNIQTEDHGLLDDQVIYLKDLKNDYNLNEAGLDVNLYSDQTIDDPIKVDLIYKNNTLYLKIDSKINNIKLANDQVGLEIKNEHYVKKTREELLKTSYDVNILDHSNLKKEKQFVVSAKRNTKIALGKVLSFGRRGKLMITSFILAGAVIAFALSMLFTAIIVNPDTPYGKNTFNLRVIQNDDSQITFKDIFEYSTFLNNNSNNKFTIQSVIKRIDENSYTTVSGFDSGTIKFDIKGLESVDFTVSAKVILSESLNTKIKHGRDIENDNEILVSEGLANTLLNTSSTFLGSFTYSGNDFGVWSYEDMLKENYLLNIVSGIENVRIVGITNNSIENIIINENLYTKYLNSNGFTSLEDAYNNANSIVLFSSNNLAHKTNDSSKLQIVNIYQEAYDRAKENNRDLLPTVLPIITVFLSFTFIGFYFVIRSSMITRIQEIGIYRALGVKRVEILSMFFFEILILTTVSTLIGYIFGFILVKTLMKSLLGALNIFATNTFSLILGLILVYAFNIFAGLLPVITLLRKTPAQILTQYDI